MRNTATTSLKPSIYIAHCSHFHARAHVVPDLNRVCHALGGTPLIQPSIGARVLFPMFKARFEAFSTPFRIFFDIPSVGNFLNFNIYFNVWVVFRLRYGCLNSALAIFDPFSSLKTQFQPCHLLRAYFF